MSDQKILKSSLSVTFSPESVDGQEHYSSQDGVQTDLFGLEALHASHSLQPGKGKEKTMSDISGPSSLISSASASLQQSLESKLRQLSDMGGSTIYKLTLKRKDTPQGRSYFQLAASALRTKESDSSSWQTPTTSDTNGVRKPDGKRGLGLNTQAQSAWPTPAARDGKGVSGPGRQEKKGNPSDTVPNAAATVPWATPTATDHSRGTKPPRPQDTGIPLIQQVSGLSSWSTPTLDDTTQRKSKYAQGGSSLSYQSSQVSGLNPWATPNTMDHMKQRSDEALARAKQKAGCSNLKDQIPYSGEAQKSSTAETENIAPSQLNPRFSLWLMGYPIEWAYSGERVTPSSRKRRQK